MNDPKKIAKLEASEKNKKLQDKEAKESSKAEASEEEDEQKGIIPEGMDFKKFIGCGG